MMWPRVGFAALPLFLVGTFAACGKNVPERGNSGASTSAGGMATGGTGTAGGNPGAGGAGGIDSGEAGATASSGGTGGSAPISEGLSGGWSIHHGASVNGARFIHPINTDKDGAMVASRLASAMLGLGVPATSDARRAALDPSRMSDAAYVDEVATFVTDELYGKLAHAGAAEQGLLAKDALVLTSVHRFGLYVAEALHARVLPLQFISFASHWSQVEAAATKASVIVGQDFDYGGLWLWNKLAAGKPATPAGTLPAAYLKALSEASTVVLVQPNDNWATCTPGYCWDVVNEVYTGGAEAIYLHTSLTKSGGASAGAKLYADAKAQSLVAAAPDADVANLKQWEWGVPDSTVANVKAAWAALGKPAANLKVIRGGVVDMFAWSPRVWRAYLAKNGVAPRGAHVSSYWVANTSLERAGAILPFPSYSFWQKDWHPLDDNARALLADVCGGPTCPPEFAANSRGFVNNIGSASDKDGVRKLFNDFGLTQANGAHFGFGINAEGVAPWTGWNDEPVPTAWEVAATDVQNPPRAPYAAKAWKPLTVSEVCGVGAYACE